MLQLVQKGLGLLRHLVVEDAHEAQCTVTLAEVSPNPPWLNGKCAMASEMAGMAPASRSSERHPATAASWSWENWAVMLGGSIRSW